MDQDELPVVCVFVRVCSVCTWGFPRCRYHLVIVCTWTQDTEKCITADPDAQPDPTAPTAEAKTEADAQTVSAQMPPGGSQENPVEAFMGAKPPFMLDGDDVN